MSEVHPITFRLKVFNAWRRGNNAPQPDPKTVGEDIDSICDVAKRLERERDEAQQYVKELYIEIDGLYNHISFLQDALHKAREQYRLSSVCRELRSENERLKRITTWQHDADPFTSPDHDNDSTPRLTQEIDLLELAIRDLTEHIKNESELTTETFTNRT